MKIHNYKDGMSPLRVEEYPHGYKFARLTLPKPESLTELLRLLWGFDLWLGQLPIFKVFLLLSILL